MTNDGCGESRGVRRGSAETKGLRVTLQVTHSILYHLGTPCQQEKIFSREFHFGKCDWEISRPETWKDAKSAALDPKTAAPRPCKPKWAKAPATKVWRHIREDGCEQCRALQAFSAEESELIRVQNQTTTKCNQGRSTTIGGKNCGSIVWQPRLQF